MKHHPSNASDFGGDAGVISTAGGLFGATGAAAGAVADVVCGGWRASEYIVSGKASDGMNLLFANAVHSPRFGVSSFDWSLIKLWIIKH
jgi:hypothetical protein